MRENTYFRGIYSVCSARSCKLERKIPRAFSPRKFMAETVLVVDGGGRAAALAHKYLQSKHVQKLLVVPGNDLIRIISKKPVKIFPHLRTTDTAEIVEIAKAEKVDLVDVAQDDAVACGLSDSLIDAGIKVFGPTKLAGQVEWDKAWARKFMKKFNILAPSFKICRSEAEGIKFIESQKDGKWFIKASGLAAGKGAIFAKNKKEAISAIKKMRNFGKSGRIYLVEECIDGEEFSAFALVSNKKFQIIGFAQDHKRVFDKDHGPNTGGMGCSSPPLVVNSKVETQVKSIIKKTVEGLSKLKRPYVGVLYLGWMVDKVGKVWVIEFNARWGDPEAQVILPSIKNDYFEMVNKTLRGTIPKIKKDNKYRVIVAAASKGYPGVYSKVIGKEIIGFEKLLEKATVFGAGAKYENNKWKAAGGRLFYVLGEGQNVAQAREMAYNALSLVDVEGNNLHYRTDIGWRD